MMTGFLRGETSAEQRLKSQQQANTATTAFHIATNPMLPSASSNVVIYLNPHADDETLTFSVPIRNDLRAHKNVYVLLLSPGEDSVARVVVNGRFDEEASLLRIGLPEWCHFHNRFHIPAQEGYHPLDKKQFGDARYHEFYRATVALGVPRSHLFHYEIPNGAFSYERVGAVIREWATLFPNATFKTMSAKDIQVDHANTGKVLRKLTMNGVVKYRKHYLSVATRMKKTAIGSKKITLTSPDDQQYILNADLVYRDWLPTKDRFALGYHSVPTQFKWLKKDMHAYETAN